MVGWTSELVKKTTVGTGSDYRAVRTPMSAEQVQARITELGKMVTKLGLDRAQIKRKIKDLKEDIKKINTDIDGLCRIDRNGKPVRPMLGTDNYNRIIKKEGSIERIRKQIADQEEAVGNVDAKQRFLQEQINELNKQL